MKEPKPEAGDQVERVVGREEFKPGVLPDNYGLARCPVCGSEAELWLHSLDFENGPITKVAMCSNGDPFFPQDGLFDGCLLYMPPTGFYRPTIREAVRYWNQYAESLLAMRDKAAENRGLYEAINGLVSVCHGQAKSAGWWNDLLTGEPLEATQERVGDKLMLIVTEIAEAKEGHRKNRMDDHLPHREMIEVELGDALIRICDLAGKLGLDLGGAVVEKLAYNANRADHKIENRKGENGKKT